jgi:hypothetical protein
MSDQMTQVITRARVCEALCKAECFVPDFTTRKKTALTWNKVYISIQEGELRFIELNFLQRIIRYLAGCIWYTDTIFRDKAALEKVKGYVRRLKVERDPIAMNLLPKAQTTTDFICLGYMLGNDSEQRGFSEEFLSEAIAVARQEDKMNIVKTLDPSLDKSLLHEILGLKEEDPLPVLHINAPDEIKYAFEDKIEKANGVLKESPRTLVGYLKALGALEKVNQELDNLPEVLRPFLSEESGQKMVQDLSDWLVVKKVHASISKAYLEDERQIVHRLCYHAGLESTDLRTQIKERVKEYRDAAMKELDAHYTLGSQSNSLLSKSTDRPVVIVKHQHKMFVGLYFEWIDGINLDLDHKPIILNVEKEIWSLVEEKV